MVGTDCRAVRKILPPVASQWRAGDGAHRSDAPYHDVCAIGRAGSPLHAVQSRGNG